MLIDIEYSQAENASTMASSNSNKSVLVVEDDFSIRQALKELLEMDNYHVVTAIDGKDGLEKLKKMPCPSLVLLDMMMPIMNGRSFLDAVLADKRLRTIPVLVVSAIANELNSAGAAAFVRKPPNVDELLQLVAKYSKHPRH